MTTNTNLSYQDALKIIRDPSMSIDSIRSRCIGVTRPILPSNKRASEFKFRRFQDLVDAANKYNRTHYEMAVDEEEALDTLITCQPAGDL